MPMTVTDPNDPEKEIEVFTKEEQDAILADKDAHVQQKLDEFKKGQSSQEAKDAEREATVVAAKKAAEDAQAAVATERQLRHKQVQDFAIDQIAGADPDVRKKIEDSLGLVNLDVKEDKDIMERVRIAATIGGVGTPGAPIMPVVPMYGGYTPQVQKPDDGISDAEHAQFLKEAGLE